MPSREASGFVPGIDTRSQIHLVYDLRLITDIWVLTIDITRGFPSTSRDLAVAALRWTPAGGFLRPCGLCGFDTPKRCQGLARPKSLDGRRALACAGFSRAVEI